VHGLFFVQVYVEEYETAMVWFVWVFRVFFCLGFFFLFSILSTKWVESSIPLLMARLHAP